MKWKVSLFLFLASLLFEAAPVRAGVEFSSSYLSTYKVSESGQTSVQLAIGLTNQLSNIFADQFALTLGFTDVKNIQVRDRVGLLVPNLGSLDNQTKIDFLFADKVVGKGKTNNFTVAFTTSDVAVHNGSIWEINIPPLLTSGEVDGQKVILEVPQSFGKEAFIIPPPTEVSNLVGSRRYSFEGGAIRNKPISAVFGQTQYVEFELSYHLKNFGPTKVSQEIALVPETNYQRIFYRDINPQPAKVSKDTDGNVLATYILGPGEELLVVVKGVGQVAFEPALSPLSAEEAAVYLQPTAMWQNSEEIRELAGNLKTAEAIYDFVTDKLSYDYSKITSGAQRLGAAAVLDSPLSAICTEFTDLFIALSRAAGIPARELQGFAFTNNDKLRPLSLAQDVLHAWPEYYDGQRQRWIQIDPTWAVTTGGVDYFHKLDLNHFVLAIHGLDPVRPLPAGAYKQDLNSKDVKIKAAAALDFPEPQLEVQLISQAWGARAKLKVRNSGQVSASSSLIVDSQPDIIDYQTKLDNLPPGAEVELELPLARETGFGFVPLTISINYDKQETRYTFNYRRKTPSSAVLGGGLGIGFIAVGVAFGTRRLQLRRRRSSTNLYW